MVHTFMRIVGPGTMPLKARVRIVPPAVVSTTAPSVSVPLYVPSGCWTHSNSGTALGSWHCTAAAMSVGGANGAGVGALVNVGAGVGALS
jgi:hypothetical protein